MNLGDSDTLEDELSHTISGLDDKVFLTVVKQYNTNVSAVVRVDDSSSDVNVFLPGETRTRGDTAIAPIGNNHGKISLGNTLSTGGNHGVMGTGEIIPSSLGRPTLGEDSLGGESVEERIGEELVRVSEKHTYTWDK